MAGRGVYVSVEQPEALGTAGAFGALRQWIAGRDVLLTNADAWFNPPPPNLADGTRDRMRLLVVRDPDNGDFGEWRYAGLSYLPWIAIQDLEPTPSGLFEVRWRDAWATNRLDLVPYPGHFIDCGNPDDFRAANEAASHE